jgi:hypothetical protein
LGLTKGVEEKGKLKYERRRDSLLNQHSLLFFDTFLMLKQLETAVHEKRNKVLIKMNLRKQYGHKNNSKVFFP